jgi:hypothetical protein
MGNVGTQMAASAVAQTAMQAQMADAQEDAMANAMSAINGAQKSNVKAGDSLTLEYKLMRPGKDEPAKTETIQGKAKANGEDVLSPMIEASPWRSWEPCQAAKVRSLSRPESSRTRPRPHRCLAPRVPPRARGVRR